MGTKPIVAWLIAQSSCLVAMYRIESDVETDKRDKARRNVCIPELKHVELPAGAMSKRGQQVRQPRLSDLS